jgi:chromate reductase, NAD(P)H dehydrogenase (quinone)
LAVESSAGRGPRGKPVAVVGATPGRWGTRLAQAALRQILHATEALVLPVPTLFVRDAAQLFDASRRLTGEPTRAALRVMLASFDRWLDTVARAAGCARFKP